METDQIVNFRYRQVPRDYLDKSAALSAMRKLKPR